MDKKLYDWDNITIVPAGLSDISSRKEIDMKHDGKLPLFIAPMDTVVDETNAKMFLDLGFEVCLPRGIKYTDDLKDCFFAYGLDEIIEMIDNNVELPNKVLIDVANGHMRKLYDVAKRIKEDFNIILMVGNIANPETYRMYSEIGVDYIRCGIGAGSGCFVGDTIIKTIEGDKMLSDIKNNDYVLTHNNDYKKVINTISYKTHEQLIKINDTTSTIEHEYYILNKMDIDMVDDENIHSYARWVEAKDLDKEKHIIIGNGD